MPDTLHDDNDPVRVRVGAGSAAIGSVTVTGGITNNSAYPTGATPIAAASGNVANAAAIATLAAAAAKTTHLSGFSMTGGGATAASLVIATITGLVGGTHSFIFAVPAGATLGPNGGPISMTFPHPIPANAVNTAIVVTLPALGAGSTHAAVTANGFQL